MLPNFLVVGASRCGTSTLHHILSSNPSVFMPPGKELHFFSDDRKYSQGSSWYTRQFKGVKGESCVGEASPPYFHKGIVIGENGGHRWTLDDDSVARTAALLPDAKVIISLRNPIKRAQSQFWKNVWQGRETALTFDQAVEEELSGKRPPEETPFCWLYKNRYSEHVQRWLDSYGMEQVLFLVFEEWTVNPGPDMRRLEQFLDLPANSLPMDVEGVKPRNKGRQVAPGMRLFSRLGARVPIVRSLVRRFGTTGGYPAMTAETQEKLQKHFQPEVVQLETLIGRSLSIWDI